MSSFINNKKGMTLVELLIAVGISMVGVVGVMYFYTSIFKQKAQIDYSENLMEFRMRMINALESPDAIRNTMNHISNVEAFSCLGVATGCKDVNEKFSLISATDNVIYLSKATSGVSLSGQFCEKFNEERSCPVQLDLSWTSVCNSPSCGSPLIKVMGVFKLAEKAMNYPLNVSNYNFTTHIKAQLPTLQNGNIIDVAVTYNNTYLLTEDGNVITFGLNLIKNEKILDPIFVLNKDKTFLKNVNKLMQKCSSHMCFMSDRGGAGDEMQCYGVNDTGAVGVHSDEAVIEFPEWVQYWNKVTSSSESLGVVSESYCASHAISMARLASGKFVGWGTNFKGRIATSEVAVAPVGGKVLPGNTDYFKLAVDADLITFADDVIDVSIGSKHACAIIKPDKEVVCWGNSFLGQFGNDYLSPSDVEVLPPSNAVGRKALLAGVALKGVEKIIAAGNSTCAILDAAQNGKVVCWGDNTSYSIGQPILGGVYKVADYLKTSSGDLQNIKDLSLSRTYGCALNSAGLIYCWGANTGGELGRGTLLPGPFQFAELVDWAGAAATKITLAKHSCALLDDKRVICWGRNSHGQLGRGEWPWASGKPTLVELSE